MEQPSARESPGFGLTSVRERAVAGAHEGRTRVSSRFASTRLAAAWPPCPRLAAATTDRHQTPTPTSGHPEHVCLRSDDDGAWSTLDLPDEIGRASCRERVCMWVVAGALRKISNR